MTLPLMFFYALLVVTMGIALAIYDERWRDRKARRHADSPPQGSTPLFRYALGTVVQWAGGQVAAQPYQIIQQRFTMSDLSCWTEYLVVSTVSPCHQATFVYESDLIPFHAEETP